MRNFRVKKMDWEKIIKQGRQGPMREDDIRNLPSGSKERNDEFIRRTKPIETNIQRSATSIARLLSDPRMGDIEIRGKDGDRIRSVYRHLADLMEKVSELHMQIYGDVDYAQNPDGSGSLPMRESMRRTADDLVDSSKKLREMSN